MKLGVCYYPEHWPPERWSVDARQMRLAGISIVRLGEFAWTLMEPAPETYVWDWLDQAIETMSAEGHQVVLCTPTAAPPAWMIHTHPEILPVDEEGRQRRFGSRRHYCPNNPTFRKHTKRIVTALANRYGEHPDVLGWQIDNEFGCYFARCYCPVCVRDFRKWLKAKYHTMDALNEAWGTVFWSQIYDQWEQIEPPKLTVAEPNPSHVLDYYRFSSDSWVAYQQLQIDTLRVTVSKGQFISHNIIGSLATLDYHDLARNLDFISWDSYPTGYAETEGQNLYSSGETPSRFAHDLGNPLITGFFHALTRGLKQSPFWVMEQQTGAINWSIYNTGVNSGAVRLWTWQALASGAEAVVYFRWRASRFGLEQHHAGLRHHDGSADTGYEDLLKIKAERQQLENFTALPLETSIGIILDYSTLWAIEMQPHRKGFAFLKHLFLFYRACKALGIEPDIISPKADFSRYKVLLAPSLFLIDEPVANRLGNFAARGGTVLFGIRSGFKDMNNLVIEQPLPGVLRTLVGAKIAHWHALPPKVKYSLQSKIPNLLPEATFWAEALAPDAGTKVLASYESMPFEGLAAITEKSHGKGKVLYAGIYPQISQVVSLMRYMLQIHKIPMLEIPAGLTVIRRGERLLIMNFTEKTLTFEAHGKSHRVDSRDLLLL